MFKWILLGSGVAIALVIVAWFVGGATQAGAQEKSWTAADCRFRCREVQQKCAGRPAAQCIIDYNCTQYGNTSGVRSSKWTAADCRFRCREVQQKCGGGPAAQCSIDYNCAQYGPGKQTYFGGRGC
jgi:hypothetical protein